MSSVADIAVEGVRHEGSPEGKFEEIGGVRSYVATPSMDYPKDKVLLYLTDVFGVDLVNHQLLADDFARNGFKTIIPDILNNDPIPPDALNPGSTYDLGAWLAKHDVPTTVHPVLDKVIAALKEAGVTKFGTTGYCFGARPAFNYAIENITHVTVVAHPSLLNVPEDIEAYKAKSKAPLLINACEVDQMFPIPAKDKTVEILGDGKFAPGFELTYWEGCTHGFAVRGDMSDPKVKAGKEGAFKASVEFLIKHL
ncbi:alpha/beta-hydrolase [Panus rudis PR-1116 ss-1]|nr:alpha/beta-hydrolase [Panus rudis PR-1116 ss-1]